MNGRRLEPLARHLAGLHSRRHVLGAAVGGSIGGLSSRLLSPAGARRAVAQATPIAAGPDGLPERRSLVTLDPAGPEIEALKRGIAKMKEWSELDPSDPMFRMSWRYQSSIHGRRVTPPQDPRGPDGIWNTCQHFSWYFFPWHRMYLYWFERILRSACGDPNFALPYWDWSVAEGQALPEVFRNPADDTNPLFAADREPTMNQGDAFDPHLKHAVRPDWWSGQTRFFHEQGDARPISFGGMYKGGERPFSGGGAGNVENPGHGRIHTSVGGFVDDNTVVPPFRPGLMTDPVTAAQDPIFWLHHANIDRLWNRWLDLGGGRANPDATNFPEWALRRFRFVDENGEVVARPVQDFVPPATPGELGYRYDDDPLLIPGTPAVEPAGTPPAIERDEQPRVVAGRAENRLELGPEPIVQPVAIDDAAAVDVALEATPAAAEDESVVILTIEGIRGEAAPGVAIEVYINVPVGEVPDDTSDSFVGDFSLFALQHDGADTDEHAEHSISQSFDITPNIDAFRERGEWQGEIVVTFVVRGQVARPDGLATPTTGPAATPEPLSGPWASIEAVTISTG